MNALTPLALTSESLLRAIQAGDFANLKDLAAKSGRNKSNMARDLAILEEGGLVVRSEPTKPELTPVALEQLAAIERANPVRVLHGDIERDPLNPRRVFDEAFIAGVAESIFNDGKLDGLLQPLLIRARQGGDKPYRLIAGENRWRAIGKLIGEGRWPVDLPVPHVLRIMSDEEAAVAALVENIQRNDLSAVDEALTFEHLKTTLGWSNADIAAKIKKTPEFVQQRLRVLTLPEEVQARMRLPKTDENRIGFKEARKLFTVAKEPTRPKAPDLSAKLALALLELAHKIETAPMTIGEPGFTVLTQRPTGGALATLNERKIVVLREWGGQVFAKIQLYTSGAVTFLEDIGFYGPKRDEVIWVARTAIMSPQRASEATRGGRYITPELNTDLAPEQAVEADADDAAAEESVTGKPVASAGVRRDRPTAEDRVAASIQADRNARETRLTELGADLPATLEEMAPHGRQAMEDYDRAQIAGDEIAAKAARERFDACAYKLNGSKLLGAATPSDQLRQTFAAPIGEVPKWGQPGRFLLSIDGMTAAVEIKDNFGWSNVGFYAVDPDAPFFSPTGFRSDFFGHGLQELKTTDGASVLVATARMMRANIVEYLRPRKPAAIDRESIARHFEYYPWIGELAGLVKHDGAAAIEEHEAAVEARQDTAETNPVRANEPMPRWEKPAKEIAEEAIISAINGLFGDALMEEIEKRPSYAPAQTHLWDLADKAVRAVYENKIPAFLAIYGRMLTAAPAGQVGDEIAKTFKRIGADRKSIVRALDGDSPDYAEAHRDCYGMVTADEDGLPLIARDPHAPADAEEAEEAEPEAAA